jgi:energy-coupling factor transporter ATP-binding protein EcfA2
MGEARKLVSPARVFARPTADVIWLGPTQQAALSQLSRPAQVRLLLGPSSSGKSTLLAHLALRLDPTAVVLQCRGPKHDATSVLASLLLSADLPSWDLSEIDQRNLLTVFIQQRRSQGRRVFLVVDEVHEIKPAAWEEIERLLVFKIEKRPAIEILVAGPTSTAQHFQANEDTPRDGGLLVCNLALASSEDVIGYLDWRLTRFEMRDVVTPVAAQVIARLSGGRYAAADVLCQMSLLLLRQLNLDRVDARVVRQAVAALAARQGAKLEADSAAETQDLLDSPPQGHLLITKTGKLIARTSLGQRTLLGRSEHNDICLPSPYLSRHHAVIVGTPEGYYLVDLNSVNGIVLNGQRVERAVLCDQDVLSIGPFRLKVQIPDLLARESPLPEAESLADTAVMPPQPDEGSAVWRVK